MVARATRHERRPIAMSRRPALSEDSRKLVHLSFGAGALLLRWLPWFEATMLASLAVCFNIWGLHRIGGAALFRPDEHGRRRVKSGIVLYPAAVVGLLLLLPQRFDIIAAAWGVLAFGDGMATLAGRRFPIRPLSWNPQKSLGGTIAFILFGSIAAIGLLIWCGGRVVPPSIGMVSGRGRRARCARRGDGRNHPDRARRQRDGAGYSRPGDVDRVIGGRGRRRPCRLGTTRLITDRPRGKPGSRDRRLHGANGHPVRRRCRYVHWRRDPCHDRMERVGAVTADIRARRHCDPS